MSVTMATRAWAQHYPATATYTPRRGRSRWSPAPPGSSARTSRARCCERGDDVRVTAARRRSRLDNLADLDVEQRRPCDVLDRRAVRRALRGVDRVFHVAGLTNLRADADDAVPRQRRRHHGRARGGAARRASSACVYTSSVAAVGPAPRGSTADETPGLPRRRATGCRTSTPSTRPRARRCGSAARGPAGRRSSTPAHVFGARRRLPLVDRARAPLPAPRDPGLRRRRAEHRRRRGRRARAPARRRARHAGRALHPRQPQLHARPPVRRPRPAQRRRAAGGQAAARRPRSRWRAGSSSTRCRAARRSRVGEVRAASLWWAFRSTKAKRELGCKPAHHEDTLQATIDWYREREPARLRKPGTRQPLPLRARRASASSSQASLAGGWTEVPDGHALPLPHADRLAVPVRARGARAAQGRRGRRRRARAVAPARPAGGRRRCRASARCPCSSSTARRSATRKRIVEHLRWRRSAPTEAR